MSGVIQQIPLEEEYKKKTRITPADIKKLRDWLETQPHLPVEHITDLDLILCFHCCNRSAEVAKQVLDLHFTLKTLFTNFFKDRVVDDKILKTLSYYVLEPLPTRAYDDSAIIFCRLANYDPKNFIFSDAVRAVLMVLDLWQYAEGTWPGFVLIIDLDKVVLSHITAVAREVHSVQQILYMLQEAMLLKVKGLHFLNAPSFMDRLMMIIRPFMKKELLDVLHIHQTGSRTIEKFLPISALLKEAGGDYKTIEQCKDDMVEKIKNNKEFFVQENKKRVVESKRPGKPKNITDIFGGIEGSFKNLDID